MRKGVKDHFEELHSGESDIKIDNTELSLKKINGKSIRANKCRTSSIHR